MPRSGKVMHVFHLNPLDLLIHLHTGSFTIVLFRMERVFSPNSCFVVVVVFSRPFLSEFSHPKYEHIRLFKLKFMIYLLIFILHFPFIDVARCRFIRIDSHFYEIERKSESESECYRQTNKQPNE